MGLLVEAAVDNGDRRRSSFFLEELEEGKMDSPTSGYKPATLLPSGFQGKMDSPTSGYSLASPKGFHGKIDSPTSGHMPSAHTEASAEDDDSASEQESELASRRGSKESNVSADGLVSIVLHAGYPEGTDVELFSEGDACKVVSPATMREEESLDSDHICDLDVGVQLTTIDVGTNRRMKVMVNPDGPTGWVSVRTRAGYSLVSRV